MHFEPLPAPGAKTVLVVEDDPDARMICEVILQRHGYRVVSAEDGETGLALAEQDPPAAMVLDISLPRMDGWEVLRRLQANPVTARIPVIVFSAHALELARSQKLGCAAFLVKPCPPRLIVESVERCAGPALADVPDPQREQEGSSTRVHAPQ